MHYYGDEDDEDVDWQGINDAAYFIALPLRKWFRIPVRDYKEKYGTVRVYTGLGWSQFYEIFYPGCCWIKPWWPHKLDSWLSYHTPIIKWINRIVRPIHQWAYRWRYKKAIQKWPHLKEEILCCADYPELLRKL